MVGGRALREHLRVIGRHLADQGPVLPAVLDGTFEKGWAYTPPDYVPNASATYPEDPYGPDELLADPPRLWPDTTTFPFHYRHPVTGKEVLPAGRVSIMPVSLNDAVRKLLDDPSPAVLATINAGRQPADLGDLGRPGRRRPGHLLREPAGGRIATSAATPG